MIADTTTKRKQQQKQAIMRLFILFAILICLNILGSFFNKRVDLTRDNRFTLSPTTKNLLHNMDDVAVIDVYLKGEFPAGFKKLQDATREMLQSFKEYGGKHIVYRFIDPLEGKSGSEVLKAQKDLANIGVEGVNIRQASEENYSEKLAFPWAVVHYMGRQMPVNLLENQFGLGPQENLFNSEMHLEYKLASAINKLKHPDKTRVGMLVGHGENTGVTVYSALYSMVRQYYVDTIDLVSSLGIIPSYDVVIINKPTQPFADRERYKIDQYIMHGGHVLWFVDGVIASMDSFRHSEQFIAMDNRLDINNQLFTYGARINADLVEDKECEKIPRMGKDGGMELVDWIYFPVFTPNSHHPIVNNLGPVMGQFVSSIDTAGGIGISKTVLLQSSKYSRIEGSPVRVSLGMTSYALPENLFHNPYKNVAVLLEGKFHSAFKGNLSPRMLAILNDSMKVPIKYECDSANSMIIVSDGDFMWNDFSSQKGPLETGYWQYTHNAFSNKTFLFNALEYLTDHSGLLEAKSKDYKLRLLDSGRVKNEKLKWRLINIGIPVILVLIFASCYSFFRKRRYEKAM